MHSTLQAGDIAAWTQVASRLSRRPEPEVGEPRIMLDSKTGNCKALHESNQSRFIVTLAGQSECLSDRALPG